MRSLIYRYPTAQYEQLGLEGGKKQNIDACLGFSGFPDIVDYGLSSDKGNLRTLTDKLHVFEDRESTGFQFRYGGVLHTNHIQDVSKDITKLNVHLALPDYWSSSRRGL